MSDREPPYDITMGTMDMFQDTTAMTDTRNPVAELLVKVYDDHGFIDYPRMHCDGDDWEPNDPPGQRWFTDHLAAETQAALAEQGYVLVNAEGLAAALQASQYGLPVNPQRKGDSVRGRAERILAALREQQPPASQPVTRGATDENA